MQNDSPRNACNKPGFYQPYRPGKTAEESRIYTVAAYAENELSPAARAEVDQHLKSCTACRELLAELSEDSADQVAVARCPSSESLDAFVFSREKLNAETVRKIEEHLQRCPLCREESAWLRNIEESAAPEAPAQLTVVRTPVAPILAMAAMLAAAFAAFLFWQARSPVVPAQQLSQLAVIKEPSQIDYAKLERSAAQLESEAQQQYQSGVELFQQGNFAEASRVFERLREKAPDHSASLFLLGYSYYKLNEPEKAFALCNQAEGIRPHSLERCMFLVNLALKTGHYERARLEITSLYHEVPDHPEIRSMYQRITALMPA